MFSLQEIFMLKIPFLLQQVSYCNETIYGTNSLHHKEFKNSA